MCFGCSLLRSRMEQDHAEQNYIKLHAKLSRFDTSTKQCFAGLPTPCPTLFALPLIFFFFLPHSFFFIIDKNTSKNNPPLNPSTIENGSLLSSGP